MSGANIAMIEYANMLQDEYDFHFILPHMGNMISTLGAMGFKTTIIHQYGWARSATDSNKGISWRIKLRSIIAIIKTCQLIIYEGISLVFTNTQIPFTIAVSAKILHRPHVWWLHEFGEEDFGFTIGFGRLNRANRKMERSSLIICNSEAVLQKFKSRLPAVNMERIYQPVRFKNTQILKATSICVRYVMFGQLVASKGHMEVLQAIVAAKKINPLLNMTLHIKGPSEDASYYKNLLAFIDINSLQNVVKIETGFFDKEKILPLYDLLIVASKAEAFGRVIVEAGKAGLKVIVKNTGGAPELVNTTNGLLYDTREELSQILAGPILKPSGPIHFNYNEEAEILRLKKYLRNL